MQRRKFITLLSGAAAAWPLAGWAQQAPRQHRIAFVHSGIPAGELTETAGPFWVRRFYQTLRGLGYAEGGNIVVERYSAEGRSQRFASLVAAVVGSDPQVIVVNLNDLIEAFTAATTTIPIVRQRPPSFVVPSFRRFDMTPDFFQQPWNPDAGRRASRQLPRSAAAVSPPIPSSWLHHLRFQKPARSSGTHWPACCPRGGTAASSCRPAAPASIRRSRRSGNSSPRRTRPALPGPSPSWPGEIPFHQPAKFQLVYSPRAAKARRVQ